MAKWNDFVGQKTAFSAEIQWGPHKSRMVGPLAMAAAIHFQLHFLRCSIQSSLEISGHSSSKMVTVRVWSQELNSS